MMPGEDRSWLQSLRRWIWPSLQAPAPAFAPEARRYGLSKSKIAAFEQCPKRLWLEVHRPEEAVIDEDMQARFDVGHAVGELACASVPNGIMIEPEPDMNAALARTADLIVAKPAQPLFEATFRHGKVLVRVDIMTPAGDGAWHVAEVKSSSGPKDYQISDVATQVWVMRGSGVNVASASIRHIDSSFVYGGDGDYRGLLKDSPVDLLIGPIVATRAEVAREALTTLEGPEPDREPGAHCTKPFECQFQEYCNRDRQQPRWPISLLPNTGARLAAKYQEQGIIELLDVPETELKSELHRLIHRVTASGTPFHDCEKAIEATKDWPRPYSYLDFETIAFAIPRWKGTGPFEQVPFQFSVHIERRDGSIEHRDFLDLSGGDPRRACAEALLATIPADGVLIAYNAAFERDCIRRLAELFPELSSDLMSMANRTVDLLPLAKSCWYHPNQRGSWSIKSVLPTIAPELSYENLDVSDGAAAQMAFIEAIAPETDTNRKAQIDTALRTYCQQDTFAMITILRRLTGVIGP